MKILLTGGCGFIGSNLVKFLLKQDGVEIINIDSLTYAGNPENLKDIETNKAYTFIKADIRDKARLRDICSARDIDGIMNLAAESHVDRSVMDASPFVETNIGGTLNLLELAHEFKIPRFLQVSTDEVYGSLGQEGLFTEQSTIQPNSPYSASKAAADHMVNAFHVTHKLPTVITRCSNNYGSYQFPEKLIPLMILNARDNKELPVYGDGLNVRDWIHVNDHCRGIWTVFNKGAEGYVYNLGGKCEKTNMDIIRNILHIMDKPESLITYVKDRPGHDRRYAIDPSLAESELGWTPQINFKQGILDTVNWYLNNREWSDNVRSGAYQEYYKQQYK